MLNNIITLSVIFTALIVIAYLIHTRFKLPNNISLLFLSQPLISSTTPVIVFIGGILSTKISPDPSLVTLPLSLMIAGVASATVPAAFLAKKLGRRKATLIGFSFALLGMILAGFSALYSHFYLFLASTFITGLSIAFAQQLRFAALESIEDPKKSSKALSVLMFSGIFAALIGPEVVILSKNLFSDDFSYAGSFFGIAILVLIAMLIMSRFEEIEVEHHLYKAKARPTLQIIKQPLFIIALLSAALSYGLMSFVMTSTPLSMHQLHGHSLESTKIVIQSHIAAMYLPSLITTWLNHKIGIKYILLIGSMMFAAVVVIASFGHSFLHYWWALIMLGVAWNFLFFSGTMLLHRAYKTNEKHKIQAINDFSVFSFQGVSSLLAGWVLFNYGWQGVVNASIPFVVIMFVMSFYYIFILRKNTINNEHI
jgi:MFS family permease